MKSEGPEQNLETLTRALRAGTTDGRRLLHSLDDNPICAVAYDASVPCIIVEWRDYATAIQIRYVHECILDLIQKNCACKLLSDDTRLPSIHDDDRRWIVESWLPRAFSAGLRLVASKKPEAHFGRVSVDEIRSATSEAIKFSTFDDMDAARAWLQSV